MCGRQTCVLGFSVDTKWAIPCNVCNSPSPPAPPLPLRYREILKGREGVSKVIYEGVAMSVPLISQNISLFSGGAYIKWNGPMASDCISHSLESVQEIKD